MFSFEYGIELLFAFLVALLFGWLWWNPPQWLSDHFYSVMRKLLAYKVNPNGVTALGIPLAIVGALLVYHGFVLPGASLLMLGFVCDFADGLIAKLHGFTSRFGKSFDPFVDSISCLCVYGSLLHLDMGGPVLLAMQLLRDMTTNWLRQLQLDFGISPAARQSGRLKNVFRFVGAGICFVLYGVGADTQWGDSVVLVVTAYSTYSWGDYLWAAYKAGLFAGYPGDQSINTSK